MALKAKESRRALYRIKYFGPWATFGFSSAFTQANSLGRILDLSEVSLRFRFENKGLVSGSQLKGSIRLLCGEKINISGQVLQIRDYNIVLRLDKIIPYHLIVREQAVLKPDRSNRQ